jgi:hypothetical protein
MEFLFHGLHQQQELLAQTQEDTLVEVVEVELTLHQEDLLLAEQAEEGLVVIEDLAHSQEQPTLVVAAAVVVMDLKV